MIDSTLKKANILIVDDQEANLDVLETLLELKEYTNIKTTTDPREVVPLYTSFKPDLILLDLTMPHLSGFEVMDQLKALVPENTFLPIIVLTADMVKGSKQRALRSGAIDFLTKPFDLIEVVLRIRNLLFTSYLQQQLHNQNQILEQRVKERTLQLESQNIELIVAKEKAEANDRLKASFINNISHEIRTPLNGILGFGKMLLEPNLSPIKKQDHLHILEKSTERLITTITNFIDISMIHSGNQTVCLNEFDLKQLIHEIAFDFSPLCQLKSLNLIIQTPQEKDEFMIISDKELLRKILIHLMDNAVKFTPQGSISIICKSNAQTIHFSIEDTGVGISEDSQNNIFEPFTQGFLDNTRDYQGIGLGLSIAKGYIGLLGGQISITSEIQKGTAIQFTIPVKESFTASTGKIVTNQSFDTMNRNKILIAEDEEYNFDLIQIFLKNDRTELLHAKNGLEAVEFCKQHADIKIVLMDLRMPLMDGFEAIEVIKSFRTDIPIIAVTAFSDSESIQKATSAGCNVFLTKPFTRESLWDKLGQFGIHQ